MGHRAIVEFKYSKGSSIFLYTHWDGGHLADYVENAIKSPPAKARVGDETYFSRIVLTSILAQARVTPSDETGWGLATRIDMLDDGDEGLIGVIDCEDGTFTTSS